jgi:DNA-binding response OmpR family regulator
MDPATVKKQILVVEDNQDLRELIFQMLISKDFDVLTAESGEKALELINLHRIDLILLDHMMPGISGIVVLKKIRSTKDCQIKNLPVVMVTAKSLIDDIDAAIFAGANDYIVKPFRAESLMATIQKVFGDQENRVQS